MNVQIVHILIKYCTIIAFVDIATQVQVQSVRWPSLVAYTFNLQYGDHDSCGRSKPIGNESIPSVVVHVCHVIYDALALFADGRRSACH